MDPISLIVAALLAGAAAATDGLAGEVVKDSYAALKGLLKKRFRRATESAEAGTERDASTSMRMAVDPEAVLEAHESDPETWDRPVREALRSTGADQDDEILAAARALLDAAGAGASQTGKYQVDARGAQGVQVGHQGTMTNTFNAPPPETARPSS